MKMSMMAVFDKKARAFAQPFFVSHTDVAVRQFKQAANTPTHQVHEHSEDFALFYFGTFDDADGKLELTATPTHVVEAIQLKRSLLTPPLTVVEPEGRN